MYDVMMYGHFKRVVVLVIFHVTEVKICCFVVCIMYMRSNFILFYMFFDTLWIKSNLWSHGLSQCSINFPPNSPSLSQAQPDVHTMYSMYSAGVYSAEQCKQFAGN